MRRDKVLQYIQSIFKIRKDRVFNNFRSWWTWFSWFSHQSPQTCKLFDLLFTTTGTWIKHHVNRVETLFINRQFTDKRFSYLRIYTTPDINDLVVTLIICDKTHVVTIPNFRYFTFCIFYEFSFNSRDDKVINVERQSSTERHTVSQRFNVIQEFSSDRNACPFNDITDNFTQCFFSKQSINKSYFFWNKLVEDNTTNSCFN